MDSKLFYSQHDLDQWFGYFNLLRDFESDSSNVFIQAQGLDIWPIIKSTIISRISRKHLLGDRSYEFQTQLLSIRNKIQILTAHSYAKNIKSAADEFTSIKQTQNPVWFLVNSVPSIEVTNHYIHGHLDAYRHELHQAGISSCAFFYDRNTDDPSIKHALVGPNFGLSTIGKTIFKNGYQNIDNALFKQLEILFKKDDLNWSSLNHSIQLSIGRTIAVRDFFIQVFSKVKPKIIYGFNYYNPWGWGLAAACKEFDIKCVDIQHGANGSYHHAYQWQNSPKSGWNTVPKHFIVYNQTSKRDMQSRLPWSRVEFTAPGWILWCKRFMLPEYAPNQDLYQHLAMHLADYYNELDNHPDDLPKILLARSFNDKFHHFETQDTANKFHLINREHPKSGQSIELPIPCVLAACDGLLTGYSASCLEANSMGTKIFATSPVAIKLYANDCKNIELLPNNKSEAINVVATHLSINKNPKQQFTERLNDNSVTMLDDFFFS